MDPEFGRLNSKKKFSASNLDQIFDSLNQI